MTVNISSRLSTVTINGTDFSEQVAILTGSDNHMEGSGLCSFQGSLTLAPTIGAQLDDWLVDSFETGMPIIIETQDEGRNFRRHPRGALRIIKPNFDDNTREQILKVGDLITLLNYRQPVNEDIINVSPTGTTIRAVIDQILNLAGITNILWRTAIADQYVFMCPIELKNSYLETVDKLLYSLGLLGWINGQEQFVVDEVNLRPSNNRFEIVLGRSDAGNLARLNAKPIPAEILRGYGKYRKVVERPARIERLIALQLGPVDQLIPGNQAGIGILRQEREIERYDPNALNQVEIERTLDLLNYWVFQGYDGFQKIGTARAQTDRIYYQYEPTGSGKLLQIYTETYKPQILAVSDFVKWAHDNNETVFNNLILGQTTLAGRTLEVFTYNEAEQLIKIEKTVWETTADILSQISIDWQIVYDTVGVPDDLRDSEYYLTEWRKENDGWIKLETPYVAKARDPKYREALPERLSEGELDPIDVIGEATSLIMQGSGKRQTSNAGLVTPPATEHFPRQYIDTPHQLEAKAYFPQFSSNFRPRERTIQIPYLPDVVDDPAAAQAVLNRFTQIQGAILKGQYRGIRAPTAMLDIYFDDYHPLMPFVLEKLDGSRFQLAMDGTTWTMNATQMIVSTDAIYLNKLVDGSPLPPYRPSYSLVSGLVLGAVFEVQTEPTVLPMGLILGGVFAEKTSLTLCWDSLTSEQFDRLSGPQLDILATTCRKAISVCWDSLTPEIADRLTAGQLDRLAVNGCIYLFTLCWDTMTQDEFDSATGSELDQLARYDCSYF